MDGLKSLVFLLLISALFTIIFIIYTFQKSKENFDNNDLNDLNELTDLTDLTDSKDVPPIYCLMITGKDATHVRLAKRSVQNFLDQDYPGKKKHLIIINHANAHDSVLQMPVDNNLNMYEFHVSKDDKTLGALRNISLQMVPSITRATEAAPLWCTWDDDDYRAPAFLSTMYQFMRFRKADVVAMTTRLEFNANTGLIWRMSIRTGCVHILARFDARVKYLDQDSMEDVTIFDQYAKLGYNVTYVNNEPRLYVRLVTGSNNTSLYVNPGKKDILPTSERANYREYEATPEQVAYVKNVVKTYYNT